MDYKRFVDKHDNKARNNSHSKDNINLSLNSINSITKVELNKIQRISGKNYSSLIGNKLANTSLNLNTITPSNASGSGSNLFYNVPTDKYKETKFSSLKFPRPKVNDILTDKHKNQIHIPSAQGLKLSNSMKSIPEYTEKKYRPISYSPKSKNNVVPMSKQIQNDRPAQTTISTLTSHLRRNNHSQNNSINHIHNLSQNSPHSISRSSVLLVHSGTSSTGNSSAPTSNNEAEIEKLKQENSKLKLELKKQDELTKEYFQKATEYDKSLRLEEAKSKKLKEKYATIKENFSSLAEENKTLKNLVKDFTSEIQFLREKEMKLMEIMYVLQKKGFSLDEIIKDVGNQNINTNRSENTHDISSTTVYFPDKIHMPNNKTTNKKIPSLDFGNLPSYVSEDSNDKKENLIHNQVDHSKKQKINKIKDFNTEFIENYDKYSESWRNQINKIKPLKESLSKKKMLKK